MKKTLITLSLMTAFGAHAAEWVLGDRTAPTLRWQCGFYSDYQIRCVADEAPDPARDEVVADGYQAPGWLPTRTLKELRNNPSSALGKVYSIPVYTEPYEMEFAAQLADSVMCGSRPRCQATFSDQPLARLPERQRAKRPVDAKQSPPDWAIGG